MERCPVLARPGVFRASLTPVFSRGVFGWLNSSFRWIIALGGRGASHLMRSHPEQRNRPRYRVIVAITLALLPTPTAIAFGLAKQVVLEEDLFVRECFLWNGIQHALDNRVLVASDALGSPSSFATRHGTSGQVSG